MTDEEAPAVIDPYKPEWIRRDERGPAVSKWQSRKLWTLKVEGGYNPQKSNTYLSIQN